MPTARHFLPRLCQWSLLLVSVFWVLSLASSADSSLDGNRYNVDMEGVAASKPKLSAGQEFIEHRSDTVQPESIQGSPHDSDDEPMVYETPRDYATWARQERDRLIAEGTSPDMVILQSEVRNYVPRKEDESAVDFTKRYVETMNSMIARGVMILNDQCKGDVVPSTFGTADGRWFDLGPGSGATKGEFREFGKWFDGMESEEVGQGEAYEVPEKFRKFEKPAGWDERSEEGQK